jgi:hypothetical protein
MANAVARSLRNANLRGFDIAISVAEGTAILDGIVGSEEHRERAAKSAGSVKGISKVINRLALSETAAKEPVNRASKDIVQILAEEMAVSRFMNWEYKVISSEEQMIDGLQAKLNELGEQGWDLVAARAAYNSYKTIFYFKRAKIGGPGPTE